MKFTDWVKDKVLYQKGIVATGETPLTMEDKVYIDITGFAIAYKIDTTRGKLDWNYDEGGIEFNSGADITNNHDALFINFQLLHEVDRDTNTFLLPHIHYKQEESNSPAWYVEWRKLYRDKAPTAWTAMDPTKFVQRNAYVVAGQETIISFEPIDISDMALSGIIQVKIWRDSANANDTATINPVALYPDSHAPKKYLGSKEEFVQ